MIFTWFTVASPLTLTQGTQLGGASLILIDIDFLPIHVLRPLCIFKLFLFQTSRSNAMCVCGRETKVTENSWKSALHPNVAKRSFIGDKIEGEGVGKGWEKSLCQRGNTRKRNEYIERGMSHSQRLRPVNGKFVVSLWKTIHLPTSQIPTSKFGLKFNRPDSGDYALLFNGFLKPNLY